MQDLHSLLKRYWGYDDFRPLQEKIIASVMEGSDTMVLLPTGGGKSLCYQIPAIAQEGISLVVSPLVALMKDQVQQLSDRGIRAACLVSGMSLQEQEVVLNNCLYGNRRVKVLYVSPERLKNRLFIEHFRQMQVSLIAVDEAHCISQWGYDFRPPYLEIAKIRQYHPSVPIMALTASATPQVVEDIRKNLQLRDARLFQGSFFRENLSFMALYEEDKLNRLLRIIANVSGSGIVYVRNRRSTQELVTFLEGKGISATYYHAGLSGKERDLRQRVWMQGKIRVMVATNAFGMGIDKQDVGFVVHLDIPSSLEAYYQEAGRAGRDGRRAYATMLYNKADMEQLRQHFAMEYPPLQKITNVYRALCNYYQIPIGSGADQMFPFDVGKICNTYGFSVTEFYAAVRYLEREGLIQVPDREAAESRMFIPASREDVYRFQVENHRYGDLLRDILRMYGGLFADFVPISESAISRKTCIPEERIVKMLQHMDALKVVSYKKKCTGPTVCFPVERMDISNLQDGGAFYRQQKSAAEKRLNAVLDYLSTEGCRVRSLLAYFGEEQQEDCGRCDYCLRHNGSKPDRNVSQKIIELLKSQGPMDIKRVAASFPDMDEAFVQRAIRELLDSRKIGMTADFQLEA